MFMTSWNLNLHIMCLYFVIIDGICAKCEEKTSAVYYNVPISVTVGPAKTHICLLVHFHAEYI